MQKNDVIYRQAAIDALERQKDKTAKGEIGSFYNTIIQHGIDVIVELPSAQLDFDTTVKIEKAYDDGYETGYLQGKYDWGDLDE